LEIRKVVCNFDPSLTNKNITILNMGNKKLTTEEATKMLLEVNLSNKYDRLKTLYQYVKGGWIDQQQFCVLIEDVFGLKI